MKPFRNESFTKEKKINYISFNHFDIFMILHSIIRVESKEFVKKQDPRRLQRSTPTVDFIIRFPINFAKTWE